MVHFPTAAQVTNGGSCHTSSVYHAKPREPRRLKMANAANWQFRKLTDCLILYNQVCRADGRTRLENKGVVDHNSLRSCVTTACSDDHDRDKNISSLPRQGPCLWLCPLWGKTRATQLVNLSRSCPDFHFLLRNICRGSARPGLDRSRRRRLIGFAL